MVPLLANSSLGRTHHHQYRPRPRTVGPSRMFENHYVRLATIPEDNSCIKWYPEEGSQEIGFNLPALQRSYMYIEQERRAHRLGKLRRCASLEALALIHAFAMARERAIFQSVKHLYELRYKLKSRLHVGENVQVGSTVFLMHQVAMTDLETNRRNILGAEFSEYGVAVVRGTDGYFYSCQYFR
jgi:uncharacterized protein YkwD